MICRCANGVWDSVSYRSARVVLVLFFLIEAASSQSVLQSERLRREALTKEAQGLQVQGDQAYNSADYKASTQFYQEAIARLPRSPATREMREAIVDRYAQSAIQLGKNLAKGGQQDFAKKLMDDVLSEDISPKNAQALLFRKQLDDPIRYEPALTKQHVKDIDQVRRLLYEAESFYSLGQYDRADRIYGKVLTIDPYNKAARRGMERVSSVKSDYYRSAYDETRARMLRDVDASWEGAINETDEGILNRGEGLGVLSLNREAGEDLEVKLRGMSEISVSFVDTNLEEAVEFLRQESIELDDFELDPSRKGFNFLIDLGSNESELAKGILSKRFDLDMKNVPFEVVLEQVASLSGTSFQVERYAIVFSLIGKDSGVLLSKSYRVPPDFLTREAVNTQSAASDFFGEDVEEGSLLAKKMSAQDFLIQSGVSFPEGSFANYSPNGSVLTVFNTHEGHRLVEGIVKAISESDPIQVAIRVTIIDALESRLEELGYDWLLGAVGDSGFNLSGGSTGNGRTFGSLPFPSSGLNPLTSGNRSGSQITGVDSIQAAINRPRPMVDDGTIFSDSLGNTLFSTVNTAQSSTTVDSAPGVLSLTGFLDTTQYLVLMRGLDQSKGVDVMTRPEIVTRPGQVASVESVRELIYPTEYEPPEVVEARGNTTFIVTNLISGLVETATPTGASAVSPANPTAFETEKIGFHLDVEPTVDRAKGIINLSLNPVLKELEGFVNYGTPFSSSSNQVFDGNNSGFFGGIFPAPPDPPGNPFGASFVFGEIRSQQLNDILMPVFKTVRASTNVDIYNGSTIVLGGLLKSEMITVEDELPIIGRLPYVGRFFKSNAKVPVRRALVIMVNAEILDPSGKRISQK